MSSPNNTSELRACAPAPVSADATSSNPASQQAVFSKKLWDIGKSLNYGFLDGSDNKKKAVEDAIARWVKYANIEFTRRADENVSEATIRVSFAGQGSWSMVGTDANTVADKTKPTLNLGWLADRYPPSAEDRATILHEFGHALGMMHEHQSPARGERITLKELEVYRYYRPLLNNDNRLVKSQIIDVYNLSTVSNFSHLDLKSIMMYFMPAKLNREGIDVPVNLDLSDLDKAFITLNYPRKDADATKRDGMKVLQACSIASIPDATAANIARFVDQGDYANARAEFISYNQSVSKMSAVNATFLNSIDASQGIQFGISDFFGSVIKNPVFKSVVKNVISQVFAQRGIPTVVSPPGTGQHDVMNAIGTLITHPEFAKVVSEINTELSGVGTGATGSSKVVADKV